MVLLMVVLAFYLLGEDWEADVRRASVPAAAMAMAMRMLY
jgi:hypothetical protein